MRRLLHLAHFLPSLSIRGSMTAIALFAVIIYGLINMHNMLVDMAIENYSAYGDPIERSWSVGPSPTVMVDVFDGTIIIVPGLENKVAVHIDSGVNTKFSRAAAEDAVKAIIFGFHQWKDSIRISARGISKPGIHNMIYVRISVPTGVSLDIRTGRGNIYIGQDYQKGTLIRSPVSASSIRARNDSDFMLANAQGSIVVESSAPRQSKVDSPLPTLLMLDAPGRIEIIAENAIVQAHAWHGTPPYQWGNGVYEAEDESIISFEGSLSEGVHFMRASHKISVKIPNSASLDISIDAEAIAGGIMGSLLPEEVLPMEGVARWRGSYGSSKNCHLKLRTDDGLINLAAEEETTPKSPRGTSGGPESIIRGTPRVRPRGE